MSQKEIYEKRHTERLKQFAKQNGLEVVAHQYDYESFGSWWFSFIKAQKEYCVTFDGRDYRLELKTSDQNFNECIAYKTKRDSYREPENVFNDLVELISANVNA